MYAHILAYVFAHNSDSFGPFGLKYFMGAQEAISTDWP